VQTSDGGCWVASYRFDPMIERPAFTIGIEEEYLVVDRESRDLIKSPPPEMWDSLREVLGPQVTPEFLKAQIEVGTKVCTRVQDAREDLANLRRDLSSVVNGYGAAIIAASTHPFANWTEQEKKQLRGFSFLSEKPLLVALNVDDEQAGKLEEAVSTAGLAAFQHRPSSRVAAIAGKLEAELATLSDAEAAEFLSSFGLTELGSTRILRASRELLDLIVFFTLGDKDCRAWAIPRGSTALQAAGAIHSDIEKHFIRAEVAAWDRFLDAGGWSGVRAKGVLKLEGKEYVVQDGDVLNIRHSG